MDLIVRNAALPDGRRGVDIACSGGRIAAVGPALPGRGAEEIDAAGRLVTPPFVDAHFHMDATLSLGMPRTNRSGTLLEGIAIWGELKPLLTPEAVIERALRYCDWAVGRGLLAIRSHVDTCDDRLVGVEALLEVRRRVAPYIDLQLVAFPQDGLSRSPRALDNVLRALDMGVDVVGGIPHHEVTPEAGAESVRTLCEVAARRGLAVDMHCDENDNPASRHITTLCAETRRLGLAGRVTGSHLTSLHSIPDADAAAIVASMADSGVSAIANPLINITLQGRYETYPKRRGMTRVPEMLAAGVPAAFGQDCALDPWYSLGSGDMLDVAHMGLHVAHMTTPEAMHQAFLCVTAVPARILGLEGYGLEPGCHADLVLLDASSPADAIRLRAARLAVVRRGCIIARGAPQVSVLALPGRPKSVDYRLS
jgi:cytosine/creatinine deaminase